MVYIIILSYLLVGGFILNLIWIERHKHKHINFWNKQYTRSQYIKGMLIGYLFWIVPLILGIYLTIADKNIEE